MRNILINAEAQNLNGDPAIMGAILKKAEILPGDFALPLTKGIQLTSVIVSILRVSHLESDMPVFPSPFTFSVLFYCILFMDYHIVKCILTFEM